MDKALNVVKVLVAAAASALGTLAAMNGLPPSWQRGVILGLAACTAVSQFTKAVGAAEAAAESKPKA